MSRHLKRYAAPASWTISRKTTMFVTKPTPGPHTLEQSMPIRVWLQNLGLATTQLEVKKVLAAKKVFVDGSPIKDPRFPVGLFDIVSIPDAGLQAEVRLDKHGKLVLHETKASAKACQIVGKTPLKKNKIQVHFSDGRNTTLDKNAYAVGDTLMLEVPTQKIIKHLPLAENAKVFLTGGAHVGMVCTIKKVEGQTVWCNADNTTIETQKKYAYPIP